MQQPLIHLDGTDCIAASSLLSHMHSTPSPSSSHSSSTCSYMFDSSGYDLPSARRNSEPPLDGDRRMSAGSTSSWSSNGEGVFNPPDQDRSNIPTSTSLQHAISSFDSLDTSSPHEVTTPDSDHFNNYFLSRNGNASPASSATSTAHSKGGVTPRQELPQPTWPLSHSPRSQPTFDNGIEGEAWKQTMRSEATVRRKYASLDASRGPLNGAFPTLGDLLDPSPRRLMHPQPGDTPSQRVVAQSSATGCKISAPLSPPAHYPGSARPGGRRTSPNRSSFDASDSNSLSSGTSSDSMTSATTSGPRAPRWAHPPRYTNKISGRAWSFSQGQERPEIDFDPELFDQAEPDAVQEILKGAEGRIAVKTTPTDYNIMAWLPGFSINDITISMKGDRTVQIVADLWDEEDHAQWNVLLGEDVNKSAISATFEGHELRVTVKRTLPASNRSNRTGVSSWSAPSVSNAQMTTPGLATYPRPPAVT